MLFRIAMIAVFQRKPPHCHRGFIPDPLLYRNHANENYTERGQFAARCPFISLAGVVGILRCLKTLTAKFAEESQQARGYKACAELVGYTANVPGKRNFEEQISALDALRQLPQEARIEPLRKGLAHRNNFIAAKAADLVREFSIAQLLPELLTAFERFFEDPVKKDPQCWAKNAISRALAALEHQEADVF